MPGRACEQARVSPGVVWLVVVLALLWPSTTLFAQTQITINQFEGLADSDNQLLAGVSALPPDANLGVGPSHIFQMVNEVGRITDKSGGSISSFALNNFFQLDAGFFESDPRVIYDAISGRWFATYLEFSGISLSSSLILAVSTTSNPTGTFCRYRLGNPAFETFIQDFPMLGVSDNKVVVSYNAFDFASRFLGGGYYVLNKADLTACAGTLRRVRVAPSLTRVSAHPVQSLGPTSNLYMVMHAPNSSSLTLLTISGVPGVTTVTRTSTPLGIRNWSAPPSAVQAGWSVLLETNDDRVLSAAWQNHSLWLAGNEACTPPGDTAARSCLRLIELRTDSANVRQDMTFGAAGQYHAFPALRPNSAGNVHVVFTSSSDTAFASVRVTGRLAADPLNFLQASSELRAGNGAQTDPSGRMGDYSGAAVDPSDSLTVWVTGEYIRSTAGSDWGTVIAQLQFSNPFGTISSLSPSPVTVGGPAFTLTVNGTGFVPTSFVRVNGSDRATTYISDTQLSATVLASDIAVAGTRNITVFTPGPSGGISNTVTLNVENPVPAITALTPSGVNAWGPAFTLTVTGTGFTSSSAVQVNGSSRTTTYVSATSLTASIPASDIATAATALTITVSTPAPGGGTSNAAALTLTQPSLAVSAPTVALGASVTVTLTNGLGGASDWLALAAVGAPATSYLQWTYVGAGVTTRTWTVTMPATPGQYEFRLFLNNGFTLAATSPAVSVANISPTPTITALSPSQVAAGSAAFTLTVTGTGYVTGATVQVGGSSRATTFVSATQLIATVLAADVAAQGSVAVQVVNPSACTGGNCASNGATLSVIPPPPAPTLTSISPASMTSGGPAFTLTATGTGFVGSSVVQVNGNARPTTFVSATQLSAAIPASDIATAGALSVTVFTPAPGGGTSTPATLTVTGPALTVSAPTVALGASVTVTLTNGLGGASDWLALAAVGAPATSYLQWTYVGAGVTTRTWTVTMPATLGQYEFRLFLNNGFTLAATSPAVSVANISPTPTITALSPSQVAAGSAAFTLTVTGTGYVTGATVQVGGSSRATTFVSATQLIATVLAADVAAQGSVAVQVVNPSACTGGNCASNGATLSVIPPPPAPTLTSISPASMTSGGPAFTLTATGTGFVGSSVVQVNGNARPTTFVSATQLSAAIPASDIATAGALSVTVFTPAPGGGTSTPATLTVTGPALTVSAPTVALGASVTVTLTNGLGGASDWLALAAVGAPATSYLQWTYVGAGVTTRTWTVTMPATLGQYEFRLFLNNGFTLAATSPPVAVTSGP